jgi:hypothetical protein
MQAETAPSNDTVVPLIPGIVLQTSNTWLKEVVEFTSAAGRMPTAEQFPVVISMGVVVGGEGVVVVGGEGTRVILNMYAKMSTVVHTTVVTSIAQDDLAIVFRFASHQGMTRLGR